MKKDNKKGFTLIELLAVIVILAIILVIAVPKIMSIIKDAKTGSMESSAKMVASAIEKKYAITMAMGEENTLPLTGSCMGIGNLDTNEYASCTYVIDEKGKAKVTLTGADNGKFSGLICEDATKTSAVCKRRTIEEEVITYCSTGENMHSLTVTDEDAALNYLKDYFAVDRFDDNYNSLELSEKTQVDETISFYIDIFGDISNCINTLMNSGFTFTGLSDFCDIDYYCDLDNCLSTNFATKMGIEKNTVNGIVKIEFLNTNDFDATGLSYIDVSQKGDNSVKGYYTCIEDDCTLSFVSDSIVKLPSNSYDLFGGFFDLNQLNFNNYIDTTNVINMSGMFSDCDSLPYLDLSSFDTSNVVYMSNMFSGCKLLETLDLSIFHTSNVTSMSNMFEGCNSLTTLNITNFDTSNVVDMSGMFRCCNSLETLDLSIFDTSNVTSMREMFGDCSNLVSINLGSFDTSKVTDMNRMFRYCTSLQSLDLSGFDTSNVTGMYEMFYSCGDINTTLTIKSNVVDYDGMFSYASPDLSIVLKGTSTYESLIDSMISTKSDGSTITKQIITE